MIHHVTKGSGPTILLIHGFLGSHFSWRNQVGPLSGAGFRVIAVDLPGFGESHQPWEADHSHTALADACAALVRQLAAGPVHAVGHSMGGRVALWLALRHRELVQSLTLVDPSVFSVPMKALAKIPGALGLAKALLRKRWSRPDHFRSDLGSFYGTHQHYDVVADYWRRYRRPENQDGLLAHVRDSNGPSVEPHLASLRLPIQLIWGEKDNLFPLQQAHRLKALLPGADLAVVPGGDHFVPESAPEQVNQILLDFLIKRTASRH